MGPLGLQCKAGGDKSLVSLTNIFNDILLKNKGPEEWMLSSLVPIFQGKMDPLNQNSYRVIKLLEHAFKLSEILDERLREVVNIDKMQYGLRQGDGLLMLCLFREDLLKNSESKIRSSFLYLLN